MDYDKCVVYTNNPNQKKYQSMERIANEIEPGSLTVLPPDDVVPVTENNSDLSDQSVIVFDDIRLNKKSMDMVSVYFSLSRTRKCNWIYLAQSYFDVPLYIRRNTGCTILFSGLDERDVSNIGKALRGPLTKDEFRDYYVKCCVNNHDFGVIDNHSKPFLRFRKKKDEVYSKDKP